MMNTMRNASAASWRFRERHATPRVSRFPATFRFETSGLGTHNVTRAPPLCPERGTRTMPKKDKAKAKQQAEDARGAVTEEVSKTVDDAQHAAGGVTSSLKDAVETVAETTTHAMSSVTHAVSSAIEKVCLPFPRARAILAALPPSTLTRRPVIPVSSERPPRRRFRVVGLDEIFGSRARRRSTRTKTERWTRETPPKSADDARRPSASSRETPQTTSQTTLLGSFQRRTVSHLRGAPAPRTAELRGTRNARRANAFPCGERTRSAARRRVRRRERTRTIDISWKRAVTPVRFVSAQRL